MANAKKIISDWSETGKTVYCIIRREADGFLLNSVDGTFGAAPANPYLALAENATIKGRYEVSEARTVWTDGRYTLAIYKQAGGSPAPVSDTIIGTGEIDIIADVEIYPDVPPSTLNAKLDRVLGLSLENHVEDDIIRDAAGNKTSSTLYLYDTAANATLHNKATGLIGRVTIAATYTSSLMTLFKGLKG